MHTKTLRIPEYLQNLLLSVVDIYCDCHKEENQTIKERTTPKQRKEAIQTLEYLIYHEKERQQKAREIEDDKRQLKMFEE